MAWRSKPRNRDNLSPNWRDKVNEKHQSLHFSLSPEYSLKEPQKSQRSRRAELLQQNKEAYSNKKIKIVVENNISVTSPFEIPSPSIVEDSIKALNNSEESLAEGQIFTDTPLIYLQICLALSPRDTLVHQ